MVVTMNKLLTTLRALFFVQKNSSLLQILDNDIDVVVQSLTDQSIILNKAQTMLKNYFDHIHINR